MAKKAIGKSDKKARKTSSSIARRSAKGNSGSKSTDGVGDAFIKLLQSPLAAELVAVAATAALASLAEQGFTSSGEASRGKRAGKAVKAAGKAAAAAVGRRLGSEIDEIRKAAKGGAKA